MIQVADSLEEKSVGFVIKMNFILYFNERCLYFFAI